MIPLKDTIPSRTFPYVNVSLIIINIGFFFYELSLGIKLGEFLYTFGLVPRRFFFLSLNEASFFTRYLPFLSSLFLHGGWFHLLGNMLFLWIFGDNVEDRMGHFKYLVFYLLCGFCAGLAHLYLNSNSPVPAVGASGAISGVMGAYFILFPHSRVITLLPVFFFLSFVEIPAFFFIGVWFLFQLLSGTASLMVRGAIREGVAWWAHIGGFLSGIALVFLFAGRKKSRNYFYYRW